MSSDKPSKREGCGDGQPLPVFLFFLYIYVFFLKKGWHYSCLNSSNTVLQVLPYSAMAEWLRPSHRTSRWCYTFPWQWNTVCFLLQSIRMGWALTTSQIQTSMDLAAAFCSLSISFRPTSSSTVPLPLNPSLFLFVALATVKSNSGNILNVQYNSWKKNNIHKILFSTAARLYVHMQKCLLHHTFVVSVYRNT